MKRRVLKRWFEQLFLKKLKTEEINKGKFQLTIVNPDSDSLIYELGISEEVAERFYNLSIKAFRSSDTTIEAINKVGLECTHLNEFYYCFLVIQDAVQKQRNPLMSLLSQLKNK